MRKRSFSINGHPTSLALEDDYWQELASWAKAEAVTDAMLISLLDRERIKAEPSQTNLASYVRVAILHRLQRRASQIAVQDEALHQALAELVGLMRKLRDKQHGCPWDKAQDFHSLIPYTLEEAYEVADAIERNDHSDLCQELGDLMFQIVFYAQIATEDGHFNLKDIFQAITDKMIRRHPQLFSQIADNPPHDHLQWETIKQKEREDKEAIQNISPSILADIPLALPALTRALKLAKRAARQGFVWNNTSGALAKLHEEIGEWQLEITKANHQASQQEFGDVLFSLVCVGMMEGLDAEGALRAANAKFSNRFQLMETQIKEEGLSITSLSLESWEQLWQHAKQAETRAGGGTSL